MSEDEEALEVLRRVIDAINDGDDLEVLANMTDDVVIVDDVAPFYRSGRSSVENWLRSLSRARSLLNATIDLKAAEISELDNRAYIVAPGQWKGSLRQEELEVNGLATATLVRREGDWVINALVWAART